jgi:C4-dicarboxylate-specific signal transduction histidine kinase
VKGKGKHRSREESLVSMKAELDRDFRAAIVRQLMATIAHEVNQPLTALVANAGAARRWLSARPPRLDKARQALSRIVKDGSRASSIIARTSALVGGDSRRREPLNLNSVVQEVLLLMKAEIRRNDIAVRVDLDDRMPSIPADRVQMQQVLVNLVLNAIEAMTAVRPRSRLLAITTTSRAARVAVAVADRGVGLKEQLLERIFEPFYTTKHSGMGIGLALCRSIIEAHGGDLSATSNKLGGATFRFRLPVHGNHVE